MFETPNVCCAGQIGVGEPGDVQTGIIDGLTVGGVTETDFQPNSGKSTELCELRIVLRDNRNLFLKIWPKTGNMSEKLPGVDRLCQQNEIVD